MSTVQRAVQCEKAYVAITSRLCAEGFTPVEILTGVCMGYATFATFLFETGKIKRSEFEAWKRVCGHRLEQSMQSFHEREVKE